jgi:hypothetical protein
MLDDTLRDISSADVVCWSNRNTPRSEDLLHKGTLLISVHIFHIVLLRKSVCVNTAHNLGEMLNRIAGLSYNVMRTNLAGHRHHHHDHEDTRCAIPELTTNITHEGNVDLSFPIPGVIATVKRLPMVVCPRWLKFG